MNQQNVNKRPLSTRCIIGAVVGRPNVGKSSLFNMLARNKLSIVTPKPQTTRVAIRAIITEKDTQLILIDSPGFSSSRTLLDAKMQKSITEAIVESDLIVFMTQITQHESNYICEEGKFFSLHPLDSALIEKVKKIGREIGIVVINKIDLLKRREVVLPVMDFFFSHYKIEKIFPVSAKTGEGVNDLYNEIIAMAPERNFIYDPDLVSDRPERFFVAEMIRESIFTVTREEVPYMSSVVVTSWKDEQKITKIEAEIWVEREGQKAILIGKGGKMILKIGIESRKKIEKFLGRHVFLALTVKTKQKWRDNAVLVEKTTDGRFEY